MSHVCVDMHACTVRRGINEKQLNNYEDGDKEFCFCCVA